MDLNQVTFPCTDYDLSVEFYKKLGLRQIVHSPPRYARFETEAGTTFSLHNGTTETSNVVIYFEVDDVDAEVERLQANGIEFESAPTDQEWLWREAYVRDPAGNRICIYHGGENRRFPAWRI
jgi:catechol 2,3-dioxygenase-like lactoylglutathione lyase family enzyme